MIHDHRRKKLELQNAEGGRGGRGRGNDRGGRGRGRGNDRGGRGRGGRGGKFDRDD